MTEPRLYIHTVPPELRDSPTMSAAQAAEPAKKAQRELHTFTVGDIFDKPTQKEKADWQSRLAAAAAAASTDQEKLRYSQVADNEVDAYATKFGTPGIRAAAAYKFSQETGIDVLDKDIAVGTGAKGVLNAIGSYFQPGEEVIVASPGWPTDFDVFTAGVKLIEVDTEGRGLISPEQLKQVLAKHPQAKAILINSPNNPTGAAYDPKEREEIMGVIREHSAKDFTVILDNPYGKLLYDGNPEQRGANEVALFNERKAVEVRSMSKEYGMAGKRVGYMVTKNPHMIAQMGKWNETRGGLDSEQQNKAQAALLFGDDYVKRNIADLREKRQAMMDGVATLQYATMEKPPGAIYAWVDFKKLKDMRLSATKTLDGRAFDIKTPADVQRYLIEAAGIIAVPGTPFYAPNSPLASDDWHFRICFSGKKENIEKAMGNLAAAEKMLSPSTNRAGAGQGPQALGA